MVNLPEFNRLLRHSGIPVGPGDSADALRALSVLDLSDRQAVYLGLRTVLVKRQAHFPVFDAAFRVFFDGEPPSALEEVRRADGLEEFESGAVDEATDGGEGGYTFREANLDRDLGDLGPSGQQEAAAAALRIARRIALRLSRRRRRTLRAARLSLRETVRRSAHYAGLPLVLVYRHRRRRPAALVLLLDVSGSMEPYSRIFLQFVHALQSSLPRTHSFCFATHLAAVSTELREAAYEAAVRLARTKVEGWGGGTRIGACLDAFLAEWGDSLLGPRSAAIILSDGLDTGEPERVDKAMRRLRSRTGRVLWMNPLAGDSRFEPLARGMAAALPHLDLLAPGHSLASLAVLERELGRMKRS